MLFYIILGIALATWLRNIFIKHGPLDVFIWVFIIITILALAWVAVWAKNKDAG